MPIPVMRTKTFWLLYTLGMFETTRLPFEGFAAEWASAELQVWDFESLWDLEKLEQREGTQRALCLEKSQVSGGEL